MACSHFRGNSLHDKIHTKYEVIRMLKQGFTRGLPRRIVTWIIFSVLLGWWANWSISDLCYTRGSCVHTDSWGGHYKVEWTYGRHCWTLLTGKFGLELLFHYYAIFPYSANGTWKICYSIAGRAWQKYGWKVEEQNGCIECRDWNNYGCIHYSMV